MIQVYSANNKDYSNNGDMTLLPEYALVSAELNGSWNLTLQHPIDQKERWKYIEDGAAIKVPSFNGEQLFRIYKKEKSEDGVNVEAYPIFFDSKNDCFLTDVRPTGKNGQDALNTMLAANTRYSAQSDIMKVSTAYYEYINLMEAINGDNSNSFLNRWGGEVLYDNFNIIINSRVGGDYGVELRYGKNIPTNGLTELIEMFEVVTRIYPKSYNGHKMSGNGYVDSPILANYHTVKAATMKFDNVKMREDAQEDVESNGDIICDTQEQLDEALVNECRKQFEAGIDKPKVTIEADMILLQNTDQYKDYKVLEKVSLGDTIHCLHSKLGIKTDARVIGLEYDCLAGRVTSVKLGDFKQNYLDKVAGTVNKIESVLRPDGSVMADKIAGILNAMNTQLRYQKDIAKKQDVRAILFEDLDPASPTYGAMCLGTQGFQISNKRTVDGKDWDWSTAFTANGGVADTIVTGTISDKIGNNYWNLETGELKISSKTTVDGKPLAEMAGIPGKPGADGKTSYFHVKYSNNPDGNPMTEIPSEYIGTYVDFSPNDPNDHTLYTWSKFAGHDGKNGIPGTNGVDGKTSYLHIAYANSSDGSIGFSTTDSYEKLYMGQYTDFVLQDSSNYRDYNWSKIRGRDGIDGTDGKDAAIQSPTEPLDKTQLWLDTSVMPPLLKRWNGVSWEIVNDNTGEIESLRKEMYSAISNESSGIKMEVAENYYTKGEAEQLQRSIGTQFEQTKKDFTFSFEEYNKSLNNLDKFTNEEISIIKKYIRFINGNIEMGEVGSPFKRVLSKTRDSYYENGVEIAYFGNRKQYVKDAEFINSMQVGNFGFIPQENGSLSFKKVR